MTARRFDQADYWRERLGGRLDLGVVGQRSLGRGYNRWLYRRRLEVIERMLERRGGDVRQASVLDVGCGSGFYVDFWRRRQVRSLVGVDVSPASVELLRRTYPGFQFLLADASSQGGLPLGGRRFDIVTLIDVVYHVVDDGDAARMLGNLASLVGENGVLLVTDSPSRGDFGILRHVRHRGIPFYDRVARETGLVVQERIPLFALAQPPVLGRRWLDFPISGAYVVAGKLFKVHDAIGGFFGSLAYRVDRKLLAAGATIPNQEMIVLARAEGRP